MSRRPPLPLLIAALAVLAGCQPRDQRTSDSSAVVAAPDSAAMPAPAAAPAAAPLSLAALAGKWDMRAVPDSGDTTATTYVLTATADSTGWTITFPDRPPVPLRIVSTGGDSLVGEAGPYASVRRRGTQVTTHNVLRLQGDRLTGYTVARYRTTRADSTLRLRTDGTRRP